MERINPEPWSPREVSRLLQLVDGERRYYQELLAAVPYPVAVVSAVYEVTAVNRSFRARFPSGIEAHLAAGPLRELASSCASKGGTLMAAMRIEDSEYRVHASPFADRLDEVSPGAVLVFEAAPSAPPPEPAEGVWLADAKGNPLSPAHRRRPILKEDKARVEAAFRRAVETGEPAAVDYRAEMSDGSVGWMCDRVRVKAGGRLAVVTTLETARATAFQSWLLRSEIEARGQGIPLPPPRPELIELNDLLRRTGANAFLHLNLEPCYISADRAQLARAVESFASFAARGNAPVFRTYMRQVFEDHALPPAPGAYVALEIGPVTADPFAPGMTDTIAAARSIFAMGACLWLNSGVNGHRLVMLFPRAGVAASQ